MKIILTTAFLLLAHQVGQASAEDILLWSVPEGSTVKFTKDFILPANVENKNIGFLHIDEKYYFDCEFWFDSRKKTRVIRKGTSFHVGSIRNPCVNCHENYSAELSLRRAPNLLALRCMNAGGTSFLTVEKTNAILAQVGIELHLSEPVEDQ